MKKNEVKVGGFYTAKVSDKLVTVRIDSTHSRTGWNATNTRTGKRIHIKSAQRLRGPAKSEAKVDSRETKAKTRPAAAKKDDMVVVVPGPMKVEKAREPKEVKAKTPAKTTTKKAKSTKAGAEQKPKRVSALDAAAQVLKETNKPMRATELIEAMAERNLWKSPGGKTPHATLYAAMVREARDKGDASRFAKVDRGMFGYAG
jgi:hypothetical protein